MVGFPDVRTACETYTDFVHPHLGSSPLSIHHTPEEKKKVKHVEYRPIAHKPSTEVYEARDEQLRIRLWELGMIHDALLKIDEGRQIKNVAQHVLKPVERS
jgi:platelet-activating factor acetylhydrolase